MLFSRLDYASLPLALSLSVVRPLIFVSVGVVPIVRSGALYFILLYQ